MASGIEEPAFFRSCWYRRHVPTPPVPERSHLLLHFGAVDYEATVWIDGRLGGSHRGGYTPFTLDITDAACRASDGELEIVVRALDDPQDLAKPRGKQDWCLKPHSIWYPADHRHLADRLDGDGGRVVDPPSQVDAQSRTLGNRTRRDLGGRPGPESRLHVRLVCRNTTIADDTYMVLGCEVHRHVGLSDPGIDDYRNELLWSPEVTDLDPRDARAQRRRADPG